MNAVMREGKDMGITSMKVDFIKLFDNLKLVDSKDSIIRSNARRELRQTVDDIRNIFDQGNRLVAEFATEKCEFSYNAFKVYIQDLAKQKLPNVEKYFGEYIENE